MREIGYKAVAKDRTSWHDRATKWRVGSVVKVERPDPATAGACGVGIHSGHTILGAVKYQGGPSRYYEVERLDVIARDSDKARSSGVRVIRELRDPGELDELAGFHLWEANNPVHPLRLRAAAQREDWLRERLAAWASVGASVWDSVRDSVWDSVRASVWDSVWDSVGASVRDSVWDSVRASVGDSVRASVWDSVRASVWDSVWDSVGDSVRAYQGGLFPGIRSWCHAEKLGPDPWRPLLDLWYAGYVPSFDGRVWRLHRGAKAKAVLEWIPKEVPR